MPFPYLGKITELGDAVDGRSSGGPLSGIALLNDLKVLEEDTEALLLFLSALVTLGMVPLELLPGIPDCDRGVGRECELNGGSKKGGKIEFPARGGGD